MALAVVLVLMLNWFTSWRADREFEKDQRACRREVVARGVQPSDVMFDTAVAVCNIGR